LEGTVLPENSCTAILLCWIAFN